MMLFTDFRIELIYQYKRENIFYILYLLYTLCRFVFCYFAELFLSTFSSTSNSTSIFFRSVETPRLIVITTYTIMTYTNIKACSILRFFKKK